MLGGLKYVKYIFKLIDFNFDEFTGTNPMISQEVSIQPQNVNENTRYKQNTVHYFLVSFFSTIVKLNYYFIKC